MTVSGLYDLRLVQNIDMPKYTCPKTLDGPSDRLIELNRCGTLVCIVIRINALSSHSCIATLEVLTATCQHLTKEACWRS
jgi:hypothetical protein